MIAFQPHNLQGVSTPKVKRQSVRFIIKLRSLMNFHPFQLIERLSEARGRERERERASGVFNWLGIFTTMSRNINRRSHSIPAFHAISISQSYAIP
jgi:hypothetical protein